MAGAAPPERKIRAKPVDVAIDKYIRRATAAKDDYLRGIQNPRRDPTEAAISMRSTLESKMASKETWDKWEDKLRSVGFKGWQEAAINKGQTRFVDGVRFGAKYWKQFYEQFKPHLESGLSQVHAMPRATIDDSVRRAEFMIRWNHKFRFKKSYTPS